MDRIDLHIVVPRLKADELIGQSVAEPSASIRERVLVARQRQQERLGEAKTNASMSPAELREHAVLDAEGEAFMKMVISHLNVSARVFDRIRKVARTIADLSGSPVISKSHLAEAVQYREQDF